MIVWFVIVWIPLCGSESKSESWEIGLARECEHWSRTRGVGSLRDAAGD